jgi:ElaB/YqjD/DUF883 family membrane-anchored ribosome-binding protein
MNKHLLRGILACTLATASGVFTFAQGLFWESTQTFPQMGGTTDTAKYYYMPKKFKIVMGGEGNATIIRYDKETMIMLNPAEKTYSELSFADLEKMSKKAGAKMDQKMAELREKLKDMPEDRRKMVEQMMGNKVPGAKNEPKLEVVKSGDTKKISGYSCSRYIVNRDGKEILSVWATKDVKGFKAIRKDLDESQRRMAAMNPMIAKGAMEAMKQIDGFPIETDFGDTMKEVVFKVEGRSIPAKEFEIPEGFKKVKPSMMPGEEGEEQQ